ncbi:putative sulfate exporter family transporter [Caulobacter sp.]|uniref:YeiH family protein n=1 Tax=Caulobacter sp. TaxID=78 RepID=UPI0031D3DD9D
MTTVAIPRRAPMNLDWLPGALVAAAIVALSDPIARLVSIPAPIIALALGMAVGCAPHADIFRPGYMLWAKPGLRIGVALLGAQVGWTELTALGLPVAAAGGAIVGAGLGAGTLIGLAAGLPLVEALIAAAAVSICGASAAMAAASALPETAESRRTTALVVVGVNLLSTLAMVVYPLIAAHLGLSERQAGVFFGLSIHDVAQVAAAGSGVSPQAGATAALAKLSRVLWLGPAVTLAAIWAARAALGGARGEAVKLAPPAFVFGFLLLAGARSLGLLPHAMLGLLSTVSHLLLIGGVAAIGAQVSPRDILGLQPRLLVTLVGATCAVALAALAAAIALA